MKTRTVLLLVGTAAVVGIGGYAAWKSPWVRAWFARDRENVEEVKRLEAEVLDLPPVVGTDWPQWRGPMRDGRAPNGPLRTDWDENPPKQLWRAPIGGGYGSCAVAGGKLYVQDRQGDKERVVCLDAETGKPVWVHEYTPADRAGKDGNFAIGPRATPTVVGNTVYAVGGSGNLFALETDGTTVKVRWEKKLLSEFEAELPQWGVACSPLVHGDMVIVTPGGNKGAVVAFDAATGNVRWAAGSNPAGYSSPVVASFGGIDTVLAFMGDALLAVRASDGKVTSSYEWTTANRGNIATPLVVKNYIFISSAYDQGSALLRADPQGDEVRLVEVRTRRGGKAFQNHHASSVFLGGYLYGIDATRGAKGLKCVDFKTLPEQPKWAARDTGEGTVVLARNHLIVQTAKGELWLVEANSNEFKPIGDPIKVLSGNNNWATPTLVGGRLYLRDEKNVVCLDVKP